MAGCDAVGRDAALEVHTKVCAQSESIVGRTSRVRRGRWFGRWFGRVPWTAKSVTNPTARFDCPVSFGKMR